MSLLQLVWFLAPTVALCSQQHQLFQTHLPAYQSRFLSGDDNVDRWTDQHTWDAVLKNVRIIVSTHAVLLDALTHGFVSVRKLALLIFDEAHHCTQSHPANQIMQKFYQPLLRSGSRHNLPGVLGLSASPVINAKARGLETIEWNLNAITKSPKVHRTELLQHVHQPQLIRVVYSTTLTMDTAQPVSSKLHSLRSLYVGLDIMQDPYVMDLSKSTDHEARTRLQNVILNRKTYCQEQIRLLYVGAERIFQELGRGMCDWYIEQCISRLQHLLTKADVQLLDWTDSERMYLQDKLRQIAIDNLPNNPTCEIGSYGYIEPKHLAPKCKALRDILIVEAHPGFTGLVFVEQRAVVVALAHFFNSDPELRAAYRVGTFVGTSQSLKRKRHVVDLVDPKNQQQTLEDFRNGNKNLIIATNVLEEGIDVSTCNIVICFDPPKNLKSFIQRRGRARKQQSKYVIMLSGDSMVSADPDRWQELEQTMREAYLNDLREIKTAEERELQEDEGERSLQIKTTGLV